MKDGKKGNGKIGGVRVGHAQVSPDKPSHTRGVHEGNAKGALGRSRTTPHTAARATGINADKRNPILPGMPKLTPP